MRRAGPQLELRRLRTFVARAERRFIAPHIKAMPTLGQPSLAESLDTAAFVVLTHGALENFFEGVGLWALASVEARWLSKRKTSRSMAALLYYQPQPSIEFHAPVSVFDSLRGALSKAKATTSSQIQQNHGIAPHHLRSIFLPLGIDVPDDPQLIGSLNLLVSLRHQWAHQYRYGAKVVKVAADIKTCADDCIALATLLVKNAQAARP